MGDSNQDTPIERLGSINVFVTELERAVQSGAADFAVHSCKDLPSILPDGLSIAAFSKRADPRDAFCSKHFPSFESLPKGAVVGTSSVRRRIQLREIRSDLDYVPIRGNVDTRLRKLDLGKYDALVVAMAGLNRLGAGAPYVVPFPIDRLVPAVGQGALAVESRSGADDLIALLRKAINDRPTELCVRGERAVLRALRAGCSAPLGVHAQILDRQLVVYAAYEPYDGKLKRVRMQCAAATPERAEMLGNDVATRLMASP